MWWAPLCQQTLASGQAMRTYNGQAMLQEEGTAAAAHLPIPGLEHCHASAPEVRKLQRYMRYVMQDEARSSHRHDFN